MSKKKARETNSLWPFYSLAAVLVRRFGVLLLGVVVVVSAIIVAYQTHQNRQATIAFKQLQDEQTALDLQWQKLRLEQSALSEHSRVEQLAEDKLQMKHTESDDEIIMKPALRSKE
ncbi:cell division protein FtsL [Kangiella shandongensis]|uniref:cell division protein FtsL n=1 Tax=Kangiella shandongensis TaxID=2763258 RepID=UPI001CBBEAF3|nr:cell division protein FtsL [Kangiella shandongensis]